MSGKSLKNPIDIEVFLPKYLQENNSVEKSLTDQNKEWEIFKKKYRKVRKEAGLE